MHNWMVGAEDEALAFGNSETQRGAEEQDQAGQSPPVINTPIPVHSTL